MGNDNFGAPKHTTIEKNRKEHEAFLKSFFRKRKNINWAIIIIFSVSLLVTILVSVLPIFSVKSRIARSAFDSDMEQKIIEDYYKELQADKIKNLPFSNFDKAMEVNNMSEALDGELRPLMGDYGVYVKNLDTGEEFGINSEKKFTAASLAKLFVTGAAYKKIQEEPEFMEDSIALRGGDKVEGNGDLIGDPIGSKYTPIFLIEKMLSISDNTAFALLSRVLGLKYIENFINDLGLNNTNFRNNDSTPKDIGTFLEKSYKGEFLNNDFKNEMFGFMQNTAFEDRIPYYLPQGTKVSHKIGTWTGAYSDAGIVFANQPYVIVVMTDNASEDEAINAIRKVSEVVYYYFNKR